MTELYLRDNVERLLGGRHEGPSPEFLKKLENVLRSQAQAGTRRPVRPPFLRWQLSIAAAALVGLGMLLFYPQPPLHRLSKGSVRSAEGRTLVAPSSVHASSPCDLEALENSEITLSDGSVAHLHSGARMKIEWGDPSMKKALLITMLAGSASFENPKGKVDAMKGQVALLEAAEAPRLRTEGPERKPQETRELTAPEVVAWMEKETKKKFTYTADLGLRNKRLQGVLDAHDPERAYEVGLSLLRSIDIAAVPVEDGQGTMRLLPAPIAGKQAKVYTEVDQLPKADEFCTLSLSLQFVSPRDVQATLINKIGFPQNVLAVESPPTILLSDYASSLRVLAGIVRQLDVKVAPPPSYRIVLALLEGTNGQEPAVPEEFGKMDLAGAVSRNRFVLLAESSASIDGKETVRGKPSLTTLRLTGAVPLLAEFKGAAKGDRGVALSELTVRRDVTPAPPGPLLTSQVELQPGTWRILGTFTGDKEGTVLVILARVTREP
jgi:hypothetical protein